jgi:hypothetical protein
LLVFLKTWDIEAELKTNTPKPANKQNSFSLSTGLWSDYSIDSKELRNKAWNR